MNRSQLEKIEARINHAETDLKNKKKSELNISRELVLIKKNLEQVNQRVKELKGNLKKLQAQIQQQNMLVKENQKGVNKAGSLLEKRLVALYKEGDTGLLKILFSADSPAEMAQQYQYFTRVLKHDKELLAEYRKAIEVHQLNLAELESLRLQKVEFLKKEKQLLLVGEKGKKIQIRLLRQARIEKRKLSSELTQLKQNAVKLKTLIARLEVEPAADAGAVAGNFAAGRGKLGWPVNGRVLIGFGQQKDDKLGTYYESNGIEISTPVGSQIKAVAAGKVVFADYFKGYGNLFILSHPGGYHTLYAQTGRMLKTMGDLVSAGDLLGHSGLSGRDSIYFEIRSKGSPVNPLSWLKRR